MSRILLFASMVWEKICGIRARDFLAYEYVLLRDGAEIELTHTWVDLFPVWTSRNHTGTCVCIFEIRNNETRNNIDQSITESSF